MKKTPIVLNWQGDCQFREVEGIPEDAKKIVSNILLKGEGVNTHVINGISTKDYDLYEKDGTMYMKVKTEFDVIHEEHPTHTIPKPKTKTYVIDQPVELDPFENEIRKQTD